MSELKRTNAPHSETATAVARERQDRMLARLGATVIQACDVRPGHLVLDAVCGGGSTSIEIARRVGRDGRVLGMDESSRMIEFARARTQGLGLDQLAFLAGDPATYPFEKGTFDRVLSLLGATSFVDPIPAFSNIRNGMKSSGRLAFACWQRLAENAWMEIPYKVALRHLPGPPENPRDPGPLAFADPERIREVLFDAGFADIEIIDYLEPVRLKGDPHSVAETLAGFGPTWRLVRAAPDELKKVITTEIRDAISGFRAEEEFIIDSASWIVTASSP